MKTVETALGAEMEEHLGYGHHEGDDTSHHRNGYSSKRFNWNHGKIDVAVPRDSVKKCLKSKGGAR